MAKEILEKILSEPNKDERIQLIQENISSLTDNEKVKCFESFSLLDFFEKEFLVPIFGNAKDEVIGEIYRNIMQRDALTLLKDNKQKLLEIGEFRAIIMEVGESLNGIAEMLKIGIDEKDISENVEFNFSDEEVEALDEEDRKIVLEKFYVYFSDEIVRKFLPEKIDKISQERKQIIDERMTKKFQNNSWVSFDERCYSILSELEALDIIEMIEKYSDSLELKKVSELKPFNFDDEM